MTNQFERPMEIQKVEALADDVATVTTVAPLPPGSRVSVETAGVVLHGKVVAIRKHTEGLYAVNLRLNTLSRTEREAILASLQPHR